MASKKKLNKLTKTSKITKSGQFSKLKNFQRFGERRHALGSNFSMFITVFGRKLVLEKGVRFDKNFLLLTTIFSSPTASKIKIANILRLSQT